MTCAGFGRASWGTTRRWLHRLTVGRVHSQQTCISAVTPKHILVQTTGLSTSGYIAWQKAGGYSLIIFFPLVFSFPVKDQSQQHLPLGCPFRATSVFREDQTTPRQGLPLAPLPPGTSQMQKQSCGDWEADAVPPGTPNPSSSCPNALCSTTCLTAPIQPAPHSNPKGSGVLSTHSSPSKTRPRGATVPVQLIYMGLYKATKPGIYSLLIPNIFSNKSQWPGCPGLPRHWGETSLSTQKLWTGVGSQ